MSLTFARGSRARYAAVPLLVALLITTMPAPAGSTASSGGPATIVLSPIPPKLPADGQTYGALVVSLTNSGGQPSVAPLPITVYLSSATPSIAGVSPSVTIDAGKSFAIANVTTSAAPGTTEVTASSVGLKTASSAVQTVIPSGFPDHLVAFAVPAVQLARTSSQGEIVVQVQDDLGIPAMLATSLTVSLASSDDRVVRLSSPNLVVPAQSSAAESSYAAGLVVGSASITASASGFATGAAAVQVVGAPQLVLKVTTEPNQISTSSAGRIVVSLQDASGNPAEAPSDIQVYLTSSDLASVTIAGNGGTSPTVVMIPKNQVYAETTFQSLAASPGTPNPQPAIVTASAHGLVSGFGNVTVAAPGTPSGLLLYLAPNPFPSTKANLPAIGVGIDNITTLDQRTHPAVATSTFQAVVTASDNATGKVIEQVTVPFGAGASYESAFFNSTLLPSTAIITASAQGLVPAQAVMKTLRPVLPIGPPPTKVVVTRIAPTFPADGNEYQGLLVSLQDSAGGPAIAPTDVTVSLSLDRQDIVQLVTSNQFVTIPANQTYVIEMVRTSTIEGTVNVTAEAAGYSSSWSLLSTKALPPAKLALYISPSPSIHSFDGTYGLLAVQLQDSQGEPASARVQTKIVLTSSNSSVLSKPITVVIPQLNDYKLIPLNSSDATTATLTAISPGLASATAAVVSNPFPAVVGVSSNLATLFLNDTDTLYAYANLLGVPVVNATVTWSANGGILGAQQSVTSANGASQVSWKPTTPGVFTYNVTISAPAIGTHHLTGTLIVRQTPSSSPSSVVIGYAPYIGIAAAGAVIAVFFLRRRRRGRRGGEDQGGFDFGEPS